MAIPSKYGIDKKINSMEGMSAYENGGKGSGNFGHAGRPGKVGGSGNGETSSDRTKEESKDVEAKGGDGKKYGKYSRSKTYTHRNDVSSSRWVNHHVIRL